MLRQIEMLRKELAEAYDRLHEAENRTRELGLFHSFPEVGGRQVSFRPKDVVFYQRDFVRGENGPMEIVSVQLDVPGEEKYVHLRMPFTEFHDQMKGHDH